MDISQLSAAIVISLAPFTPYLAESGKRFAGQVGDAAWKKSQELWNKLVKHFGKDKKIKDKLSLISRSPEDQKELLGLIKILTERLKSNPKLANELYKILGGTEQAIQEVLSEKNSWIEKINQELQGGGKQTISAKGDSMISGVKQTIRK